MDIALHGDLSTFDGAMPVSYVQVLPTGETVIPVGSAVRRAVNVDEARLLAPQVALTPDDTTWHLPVAALDAIAPAAGDRIVTDDEVWIVLAATKATLQSRWRMLCRRAR